MKKDINIYLPLFTGFYNTIHDNDYENLIYDFEQCINDWEGRYSEKLSPEDIWTIKNNTTSDNMLLCDIFEKYYTFDSKEYRKDYGTEYVYTFNEHFKDDLEAIGISDIKFNKIVSPTYYNYGNDEIDLTAKYDFEKVMKFLNDNTELFTKYIKEHNSSYDGFIPYGTNDIKEYLEKKDFEAFEITQIIDFYVRSIANYSEDEIVNLHYETSENVYNHEYVKELEEK